ncbi:MAG: cupin domain-containing protein [Planctomycetota bacterium]
MTDQMPDEMRDLIASYVAGALSKEEAEAVESMLNSGHEAYLAEFHSMEPVLLEFFKAVVPQTPPPAIRESLLHRIDEREIASRRAKGEVFIQRDQDSRWIETGSPGVRLRSLFVDHGKGRQTYLIRAEAGASFPAHKHLADEECFILEGDLSTMGNEFHTGDYLRFAAGTVHDETRTRGGCLILMTSAIVEIAGRERPQ